MQDQNQKQGKAQKRKYTSPVISQIKDNLLIFFNVSPN